MRCVILSCHRFATFLVDHPDRGELEVCRKHAENIAENGGKVVALV